MNDQNKDLTRLVVIFVVISMVIVIPLYLLFGRKELKGEAKGGEDFRTQSVKQMNKYPITTKLPYIDWYFRIDYGVSKKSPNDPNAVALYVTVAPQDKQKVLDWFKANNYNPNNYEIIYRTE